MKANERLELVHGDISIAVKSKGAEWCSLINRRTETELLWEADPNYWGRHSCVLFPFIGKLKDGQYQINGDTYHSGQHGFLRDREFELSHRDDTSLSFSYQSTDSDLELYPFPFTAEIKYELHGDTVFISYIIKNDGDRTMYFSLGGHPGFTCPVDADKKRSDYRLEFNEPEHAHTLRLNDSGLINTQQDLVLDHEDTILITDNLFDNDALILSDLNSNQVSLIDNEDRRIWTFDFSAFTHLGIWSKDREAPFVCIEPWYGLADYSDHDQQLKNKKGILNLESGASFTATHSVRVH